MSVERIVLETFEKQRGLRKLFVFPKLVGPVAPDIAEGQHCFRISLSQDHRRADRSVGRVLNTFLNEIAFFDQAQQRRLLGGSDLPDRFCGLGLCACCFGRCRSGVFGSNLPSQRGQGRILLLNTESEELLGAHYLSVEVLLEVDRDRRGFVGSAE